MITVVSVTDPKRSMSMLSQRDCQKFMLPWIHGRLLLKMVYIIYKMCMTLIAYFCVLLGVFLGQFTGHKYFAAVFVFKLDCNKKSFYLIVLLYIIVKHCDSL